MRIYLSKPHSISHQNSFDNIGFSKKISPIDKNSKLISPNYREFIPANQLRRYSEILRASLTLAIKCKNETYTDIDAIIVGTGLGCITDTEKFLETINNKQTDNISPSSFINSTHNTISGLISLFFKNYNYNITHTQNSVSFEASLIDATICLAEGKENVLLGAADEKTDFLDRVRPLLPNRNIPLTTLASFLTVSKNPIKDTSIVLKKVEIYRGVKNVENIVLAFLKDQSLKFETIDLILHSNLDESSISNHPNSLNYLLYSGVNMSASAYALHLAYDHLINPSNPSKNALLINHLCTESLGIMLVKKHE